MKRYMDKHLSIKLNASRKVTGILRGYDQFMNMVRRIHILRTAARGLPGVVKRDARAPPRTPSSSIVCPVLSCTYVRAPTNVLPGPAPSPALA